MSVQDIIFSAAGASTISIGNTWTYSDLQNTWAVGTSAINSTWNANSNNFIVYNISSYPNRFAVSNDLITWSIKPAFSSFIVSTSTQIATCNDTILIAGGNFAITSNNLGNSWTNQTSSYTSNTIFTGSTYPITLASNNNTFLAASSTGYTAFATANGAYWYEGKLYPPSTNLTTIGFTSTYPLQQIIWLPQNSLWIGVGANAAVTSSNGRTWTLQSNFASSFGIGNTAYGIATNGASNMCAVGTSCATSTDGVNWTYQSSFRTAIGNSTEYAPKIVWSNSQYVAVTNTGNIITSTTGSTWTKQPSSNLINQWTAYNGLNPPGTFPGVSTSTLVASPNAVAIFGKDTIAQVAKLAISSNGTSWSLSNGNFNTPFTAVNNIPWDVNYNKSQYLVIGSSGDCATSPDGINWTKQNGFTLSWFGLNDPKTIAWTGSQYVVSGIYAKILTSSDGVTWTNQTTTLPTVFGSATTNTVNKLIYTGNQYIAVGTYGKCATSSDAINWNNQANFTTAFGSGAANSATAIANNGTLTVVVGTATSNCVTSTDLVNWTPQSNFRTVFGANTAYSIVYGGTKFLVVGQSAAVSSDGINWTSAGNLNSLRKSIYFQNCLWTGTQYVVMGLYGDIFTSFDGINWTSSNSSLYLGVGYNFYSMAYNQTNNQLVTCGYFQSPFNQTRSYYSLK